MKKITQEQVWNNIAKQWSQWRNEPIKEVAEFLKNKKGKILDVGCGSGRNIIATKGLTFYGVDFSASMLKLAEKEAKKRLANAIFFKSKASKLDFKDNYFDYAIFISALHCIETKEERKKALEELYRVMKKNAEGLITVWDKKRSKNFSKLASNETFIKWKKEDEVYKRYYYFYENKELASLLAQVGFKLLKKKSKGKHSDSNLVFYVKK